jgi:hypothetical protein
MTTNQPGSSIQPDLDPEMLKFRQYFESNHYQNAIMNAVNPRLDILDSEIASMKNALSTVQDKVASLERQFHGTSTPVRDPPLTSDDRSTPSPERVHQPPPEDAATSNRLYNLKINGLKGSPAEAKALFIQVARDHLATNIHGCEVAVRSITTRAQQGTSFIFSFSNMITRRKIWSNRMCLRSYEPAEIYISDDLNPVQSKTFYKCRQMKKEGKIMSTWTSYCKIYVKAY